MRRSAGMSFGPNVCVAPISQPAVRQQILKAAGKGVRFQMMINQYSPSLKTSKRCLSRFRAQRWLMEVTMLFPCRDCQTKR